MNIVRANSEPFYQFHRFGEELNRNLRITVAGLALVKRMSARKRSTTGTIRLPKDGEPWGNNDWKNPSSAVPPARKFVSQMGVVRSIGALEDFCIGVKAEYDRFPHAHGRALGKCGVREDDERGVSPMKLYSQLGWDTAYLARVEPLYNYFSKMRNCIVHRSGRANEELYAIATSSTLRQCTAGWHASRKRSLPALPAIAIEEDVQLQPRHAALATEVCRRIAVDANEKLISHLGVEGVVYMAAHHSLLADHRVNMNARGSAQAVLNAILSNRYRVRLDHRDEGIQVLGKLDKWKLYLRKFERLFAVSRPIKRHRPR
jgi:hypothetical protein